MITRKLVTVSLDIGLVAYIDNTRRVKHGSISRSSFIEHLLYEQCSKDLKRYESQQKTKSVGMENEK